MKRHTSTCYTTTLVATDYWRIEIFKDGADQPPWIDYRSKEPVLLNAYFENGEEVTEWEMDGIQLRPYNP